jgi:hypothetical protein
MVKLYGRSYTRAELLARMGSLAQIGGVRLGELADGAERGVRVADFRTGTGFNFTVHIDRGLDIGLAEFKGTNLSYRSIAGVLGPAYYEREGAGWVRGFPGGLLVTCGLTTTGSPSVDDGQALGQHGPISFAPASNVWADGAWQGDEYEMWVQGRVREAAMYNDKMEMVRRISARLGEPRLTIHDRVTNIGTVTTPHMIIYHCNMGFPLLSDTAELVTPAREVTPRDQAAAPGLPRYNRFEAPTPARPEEVFYHDNVAAADGFVTAALVNRALNGGLGIYVRYRQAELPRMTQWKSMAAVDYVLGIEPSNCRPEGRAVERARGTLQFLEPGETREYVVEIGVLEGEEAISRRLAAISPK